MQKYKVEQGGYGFRPYDERNDKHPSLRGACDEAIHMQTYANHINEFTPIVNKDHEPAARRGRRALHPPL